MGNNDQSKNDKIPVQAIKETERVSIETSKQLLDAEYEFKLLVLFLCSQYAYTIKGLASFLKARTGFKASAGLFEFLKIRSYSYLKKLIDKCIFKEHYVGGSYGQVERLYDGWKKTQRPLCKIFRKTYFYYDDPDYIDPYILEDNELPLHVNKKWPEEKMHEVYLSRMRSIKS